MPAGLDGLVAVGVLLTAGGALLLRLLAAPYLIWKDDQVVFRDLLDRLDDPKRSESLAMSRYSVDLRKKLSKRMAAFLEFAQLSASSNDLHLRFVVPRAELMIKRQREVTGILWQLGHDVMLRVACWNLVTYCSETITLASKGDFDPARSERIKKQARHTMTLIHNPTGEEHTMAIAQIEAILTKDGESLFKFGDQSPQSLQGTEPKILP